MRCDESRRPRLNPTESDSKSALSVWRQTERKEKEALGARQEGFGSAVHRRSTKELQEIFLLPQSLTWSDSDYMFFSSCLPCASRPIQIIHLTAGRGRSSLRSAACVSVNLCLARDTRLCKLWGERGVENAKCNKGTTHVKGGVKKLGQRKTTIQKRHRFVS